MSNNRLVLQGMDEFKQALRNMPSDLAGEADGIVTAAAEGTKSDVVAAYPEVTGNLKRGVTVKTERSAFGVSAVVKSNAKHSHLYEFGSQMRHTDIGANRGAMPARPVFVPVAMRRRKAMYEGLKGLLRRAGFTLSGDV
jgi:hypothetical protein